jgi:hypothetical protein
MWSKNPIPVSIVDVPLPSNSNDSRIDVSDVFRSISPRRLINPIP